MGLVSCATATKQYNLTLKSKRDIESSIYASVDQSSLESQKLLSKISSFKEVLSKGGPKTASDWKLHDDLLDSYLKLKISDGLQPNQILVPANTKLSIKLPSFCLNSHLATPSSQERFKWIKSIPKIPYYNELLVYASSNPVNQKVVQELVWNLQNKTRWEEYPNHLKDLLKKIDPRAPFYLPSYSKDRLKNAAFSIFSEKIPSVNLAKDAISFIEGKYYSYDQIQDQLRTVRSPEQVESEIDTLDGIPDTSLYAETQSTSFLNQSITFYNPSDQNQVIKITDYHLVPYNVDVQPIGIINLSNVTADIVKQLEDLLFGDMLRLGIGFTPLVNDISDAYEFLSGKDFVTGENLSSRERALSVIGLFAGTGTGFRYANRVFNSPAKYLVNFESNLIGISGKSSTRANIPGAKKAFHDSKSLNYQRISANEVNNQFRTRGDLPPYQSGTMIAQFKSQAGDKWVRVHGDNNQIGKWMMREEAIKGLSPQQIKTKYSLPSLPSAVSDVIPDAGTQIRRGRVKQNFGGNSGAVQYEIVNSHISDNWYKNKRPLK